MSIAGSDSSGGAGMQGDLRTMMAFGVHGVSVVTAVTAQDSAGARWWPVAADAVSAQLAAGLALDLAAIKTGMLGDADAARAVVAGLLAWDGPLVVDPVCRASSGVDLLDPEAFIVLRDELLPRSTLITPNLAEAEALTGGAVRHEDDQRRAAQQLVSMGARAALVTGGHLADEARDVLFDGSAFHVFAAPLVSTAHTHGTGCALASAIASRLALGDSLVAAVDAAKSWITGAIAGGYPLGGARGPVDHAWQQRAVATPTD
jgi:hydroxymethylpyrimidine/phosphomethylpyrimidine kinase